MASITYRGTFCNDQGNPQTAGANGRSAYVSGDSIPDGAIINNITYTLDISADGYSSSKQWQLHWFAIGDSNGSPSANWKSESMSGTKHTFNGSMSFSQSDVEKFAGGSFEVYGKANTTHDSKSYMGDFTITVTYEVYTRCTAPEWVSVDKSVTPQEANVLKWGGASGGNNNAISGYFIQYADSSDNKTWGSWTELKTVGVVNSAEVNMPASNTYRKYKVWTLGAAGTSWRSANGTESDATYRGHAALDGFTDSPLVAGQTPVKALHMRELQDRANTLRGFYGLSAYNFTTITSGTTKLKDWTAHVEEIRAAVDEIGKSHAAWISFSVNCPRADVIEQLRAVILSM